ncbi:Sua5/YciO/YrdC/YwlC family protein [bacterium]|nr:Sua5/YciO/YrdC/YwlC family protein [bacterium]MBU1990847.1 Sua5/YciO/YrdC/YwlC family protein [bacterium]
MPVILMQTDTTVGFLSQDEQRLYEIKSRETTKPFIKVFSDFKTFAAPKDKSSLHSALSCNRIPHAMKNFVRRSRKTTFIIKNMAFRVAKTSLHSQLLRNESWHFSTSANQSGKNFDRKFCEDKADIIIENINGLSERQSSKLYKINNIKKKRIR